MPTIITVHMANTNANSIACDGVCVGIMSPMPDGMIRKPVRSMPPIAHIDREPQQVTPRERRQQGEGYDDDDAVAPDRSQGCRSGRA